MSWKLRQSATPSVLLTALLAFSVQRCSLQKLVVVDGSIHRHSVDPRGVAGVWRHCSVHHRPLRGAPELSRQFSLRRAEGTEGTEGCPGLERFLEAGNIPGGYLPLWKIMDFVSWDGEITEWNVIKSHVPDSYSQLEKSSKSSKPTRSHINILLPSYQTWPATYRPYVIRPGKMKVEPGNIAVMNHYFEEKCDM